MLSCLLCVSSPAETSGSPIERDGLAGRLAGDEGEPPCHAERASRDRPIDEDAVGGDVEKVDHVALAVESADGDDALLASSRCTRGQPPGKPGAAGGSEQATKKCRRHCSSSDRYAVAGEKNGTNLPPKFVPYWCDAGAGDDLSRCRRSRRSIASAFLSPARIAPSYASASSDSATGGLKLKPPMPSEPSPVELVRIAFVEVVVGLRSGLDGPDQEIENSHLR